MRTAIGRDPMESAVWSVGSLQAPPAPWPSLGPLHSTQVYELKLDDFALRMTFENEEPIWLSGVIDSMNRLLALPPSWDSYGAKAISPKVAATALGILNAVMGIKSKPPVLVPTTEGGLQLEWHAGGVDLEIEVGPSGRAYAFYTNHRNGVEWEGDVTGAGYQDLANRALPELLLQP